VGDGVPQDVEAGRPAGRGPVDAHSYLEALGAAVFGATAVRGVDETIVDFEFDYCNPAALDVVGRDYADIIGHRLLDLFPLSIERGLFDAFVGVVESGQPTRFEFSFAEAGVSGDFEAVVSRHRDGYVLAAHEISARVQRERELVLVRDQLQSALTSRVTIEQAKGFLAARAGTDPETAFLAIRRHARDHNKRLIDVARSIVLGDIQLGRSEDSGAI